MDIDENAPVITRNEILIDAPIESIWGLHTGISSWSEWLPDIDTSTIEGPLAVGTVFRWQTYGLTIESSIQEIDPPRRIVWSGPAQGITAIHVWTMTPGEDGVLVHTEESWDGDPVCAQPEEMQQALDGSLRAWLQSLKHKAETQGRCASPAANAGADINISIAAILKPPLTPNRCASNVTSLRYAPPPLTGSLIGYTMEPIKYSRIRKSTSLK